MKRLITDISKLGYPAEPFTFLSDSGITEEKKTEAAEIITNLKKVINDKNLCALSAPQIGINKRIFCIKFDDQIKTFINPIITKKMGISILPETFGSLPGKEILIARPQEITAVYYTDEFKYEDNKFIGAAAQIFDQQSQVLDGILPTDLGLVSDVTIDGSIADLTDEERQELLIFYKNYLQVKQKALDENITDEEKAIHKKLKFTEDVINGRIQVVDNTPKKTGNRAERRKVAKIMKKVDRQRRG